MALRTTISLVLASLISSSHGQLPFFNFYEGSGTPTKNIDTLSSGNVFGGIARSSGTSLFDPNGNLLHTQCYQIDTFMVLQAVRKVNDNEFAFVGIYRKDTCDVTGSLLHTPALGRMDSLGNILNAHYYPFSGSCKGGFGGDLLVTSGNDVIAWGRDRFFFALRADPAGEVRWAKRYGNGGGISFIKELPGGDLIAGMNMDTSGAVVARMDENGQVLWAKSYFRPRGMITDCLVHSDDSFTMIGFNDSSATTVGFLEPASPDYQPELVMLQLNGAGELQWCKSYDSAPNYWYTRDRARIKLAADGLPVIFGNIGLAGYNQAFRPFLMKTDLNGDTLWTRSYGAEGDLYNTREVLPCADGTILCSGWEFLKGSFLFRTDTQGYLPCHGRMHSISVSDLFPVDSAITLFHDEGAEAFHAYLTPTTYPPLEVTDACSPLSLNAPRPRGRIRIQPNPTPGRFSLSFPDPLKADSYYSVFDATGRLLYQRPLSAGGDREDVDLSRFGSGTYILRITDPEGQRNERVVVE